MQHQRHYAKAQKEWMDDGWMERWMDCRKKAEWKPGEERRLRGRPTKTKWEICLLLFRWSFSKLIVASCLLLSVCTVCRIQGGLLLACWHLISTWHPHPYSSPYILFLCLSIFQSCCPPRCLLYKTHRHHVYRAVHVGSSCTESCCEQVHPLKFIEIGKKKS